MHKVYPKASYLRVYLDLFVLWSKYDTLLQTSHQIYT